MKTNHKIQMFIGIIISAIIITLCIVPVTGEFQSFVAITTLLLSIQILYLTIIIILNTSKKDK